MPKIQSYEAQVIPDSQIQTRQASGVSIGGGLQDFGRGIQQAAAGVERYQTRIQVGESAKGLSDSHVAAQDRLKKLQSPLDDKGMADFMSKYDEDISKLGDKVSTGDAYDYFSKASASDRKSVQDALIARNAMLLGAKQREDFAGTLQNKSTIVYGSPTADTFHKAISDLELQSQAMTGENEGLKDKLLRESGKEIAMAHFQGSLQMQGGGGQYAKGVLASGFYDKYVDGTDKAAMMKLADNYDKAKKSDSISALREAEYIRKVNSDHAYSEYFDKALRHEDVSDAIVADKRLIGEDKYKLISQISAVQTKELKINALSVYTDLESRIYLPPSDPNSIKSIGEINSKVGDISLTQRNALEKAFVNNQKMANTPEGQQFASLMKSAKELYTKKDNLGNPVDQFGQQRFADFSAIANQKVQEYREANKPLAPLFDRNSPESLYNSVKLPSRAEQRANLRAIRTGNQPGQPGGQAPAPKLPPPKSLDEVTKRLKEAGL